jgi:predicted O-methyltransferase YrrM
MPKFKSLREFLGYDAGAVIEVGAYEGRNGLALRRQFPIAWLYLVDPWCPHALPRTYAIDNSPEKWARVEAECRKRFAHDPRASMWKMTSAVATKRVQDKSLDVVFLDAGREYSILQTYISEWLPKLKPGGVMAGKGLAGAMRGDVGLVLQDRWGKGWTKLGTTVWAAKP